MDNIPTTEEIEKIKAAAVEDLRKIFEKAFNDHNATAREFTNPLQAMSGDLKTYLERQIERLMAAHAEKWGKNIKVGAHVSEIIRLIVEEGKK